MSKIDICQKLRKLQFLMMGCGQTQLLLNQIEQDVKDGKKIALVTNNSHIYESYAHKYNSMYKCTQRYNDNKQIVDVYDIEFIMNCVENISPYKSLNWREIPQLKQYDWVYFDADNYEYFMEKMNDEIQRMKRFNNKLHKTMSNMLMDLEQGYKNDCI